MGEFVRYCPKCNKEIHYTRKQSMISAQQKNRKCRSCTELGENNPMFGRKRPDWSRWMKRHQELNPSKRPDVIRKLREIALSRTTPNFNPNACKIIDVYGKKHGYNFQHALNGGEVRVIGYALDGYDKDKNVVIEYYEKRHEKKRIRDARRKQEIIEHLNCKFIELYE